MSDIANHYIGYLILHIVGYLISRDFKYLILHIIGYVYLAVVIMH